MLASLQASDCLLLDEARLAGLLALIELAEIVVFTSIISSSKPIFLFLSFAYFQIVQLINILNQI